MSKTWRHGKIRSRGYIVLRKEALEHRVVIEETDKCCLLHWAEVHHINGVRDDNRRENLLVTSKGNHSHIHYRDNPLSWISKETQFTSERARIISHKRWYTDRISNV